MEYHQGDQFLQCKGENVLNHYDLISKIDECSKNGLTCLPVGKKEEAREADQNCTSKPFNLSKSKNNFNKTTSELINKETVNINLGKDASAFLSELDPTADNLLQSIDLSFLSNDFSFEDCTGFEQASQLVDPTLKDFESTPFSFNNNDSVQLFKFNLTESTNNDSIVDLGKNIEDIIYSNTYNNSEKMLSQNDSALNNDAHKFYHVFEMIDNHVNMNEERKSKSFKDESVKYKQGKILKRKNEVREMCGPIKKGRRYSLLFKQEVLKYAKNHTFKETALRFKINCNTITEWSREYKRLSVKQKGTTSLPVSDNEIHKTDIIGTPISKTEIIFFHDDICLETESSLITKFEENLLSSVDMKPDEKFLKWIKNNRLQKRELSRQEVFNIAKYCLQKSKTNQEASEWFVQWLNRYNRVLNSLSSNNEAEKYIKYPKSFKLEAALYASLFTKNSAARVFNVCRKRLFDWFKHLHALTDSFALFEKSDNEKLKESIVEKEQKKKTRNKIYTELHMWYEKMVYNGSKPTSNKIKEKAKEIFLSHGLDEIKFSDGWLQKFCKRMNIKLRHNKDDELLLWILTQFDNNISLSHQEITEKSTALFGNKKFKGSKGWTLRFLKRHKNLLQRLPTCNDQLPNTFQEKLNLFWQNFRKNVISSKLLQGNIGCMDEVPINLSYPEDGKLSLPLLRKTGFEYCQAVVLLSALANGRILPPAVVFKGSGSKQLFPGKNVEILIFYQEKGLVTNEILEAWASDIWLSCVPSPSALILDSFEPHSAIKFTQILTKGKCLVEIIPEGCSFKFQPLDADVTSFFKEIIKNQWKDSTIHSDSCSLRMSQKYHCPSRDTILRWIENAYNEINRNPISIINSFKTTGLLQ